MGEDEVSSGAEGYTDPNPTNNRLTGQLFAAVDANGNTTIYSYTDTNELASVSNGQSSVAYTYDTETGLYYLNSRYYDPEVCRFINADSLLNQDSILGYNMFAYCFNNPVNMNDQTGYLPKWLKTAAVALAAVAVVTVVATVTVVSGGSAIPVIAGAVIGAVTSGAVDVAIQ